MNKDAPMLHSPEPSHRLFHRAGASTTKQNFGRCRCSNESNHTHSVSSAIMLAPL